MRRAAALAALGLAACGGTERAEAPPSVLWIVWDTVRADRLSLYGYERETTPFLDAWARDALVFDECRSVGSSTVPAHASMFTGLLPSEHGANNKTRHLDERFTTIAELFRDAGYATYLYSANPNIQFRENFEQGFAVEQHPWDPERRPRALELLRAKADGDRATELRHKLSKDDVDDVHLKACGELASDALLDFLADRDPGRPYFAFLNYMEAHEPLVPPRAYRERFLSPDEVDESYEHDRTWRAGWQYTYGLRELDERYFRIMGGVYDATLAELDELLSGLLARLEAAGALDNTIVVLTSDHGEHLGEHRLVGHRYSLYEGVLRVPLVLHAPGRVEPGRSDAPVTNMDLFPTLLALAGIEAPAEQGASAVDLRDVPSDRVRIAEYPGDFPIYAQFKDQLPPDFEPERWLRRLRAVQVGADKLIWSSDGEHELYALDEDADESRDLAPRDAGALERMLQRLDEARRSLVPYAPGGDGPSEEFIRQLEGIGY
ncbi:MAG: sulfatase [Planctomycetota bacterium]